MNIRKPLLITLLCVKIPLTTAIIEQNHFGKLDPVVGQMGMDTLVLGCRAVEKLQDKVDPASACSSKYHSPGWLRKLVGDN
jgi:hypothetical protein